MKTKKRVRRLLSLWLSLVMIVSNLAGLMPGMSLTAYAADTTITWDTAKLNSMRISIQSTEPASQSKTSDGITVTVAKTVSSANYYTMEFGSDIMANTQGYFTFESSVGNISKIEINQTGGGRWRSGGAGWPDDFSDFSSTPFTWSGTPAASVTLTGNQGDRLTTISSIVFTIENSHDHSFTYTASGNTITATCSAEDCDLTDNKTTLTITAPTLTTYGGTGNTAATLPELDAFNSATGKTIAATDIKYVGRNSTTYAESATAPTGAGDYTAKITVEEKTASVDYEIAKADATVPTGLTATYGQTLADVALPTGWTWADSTQSVGNIVTPPATFKANFAGNDNYNAASNVDVTVTVSKAANPATVTGTATVTKGGNTVDLASNVALNGATGEVAYAIDGEANGCTLSGSVLTSGENTGSVTVNVSVAADNNYEALAATPITVTISDKGTQTITAADMTATYGDTDKKVEASTTGDGTLSYSVKSGDAVTVDVSSGALTIVKAGTATITVTASGTATYEQATKDVTVTVNKATPTVTAPTAKTLTYTGSAQELITVGEAEGGTLYYAVTTENTAPTDDNLYTTSIPTATDAGTYYVWYKVKGDANHADSTPVCITVTIEAASLSDRGVTVYAIPDQNYTGEAIEPMPVVKYLGYLLKEGTDYTLSYTNNTARWESGADQPAVTITGMGNYSGTLTAGFKIIVPAYEGILSLSLQGSITYGTPLGYAPEVMSTGNLNGETTNVYYSNSNSGEGTLWDSTKILNAGTWYVWAELDATTAHDKAVSKRQTLTVNKAQYETPVARILPEQTDASYEVSVVLPAGAKNTDYEYAITAGTSVVSEWSTLPVIKGGSFAPAGLSAGTEYTISLRRKADANHFASEAVSKTFSTPAQVVLSYDANGGSGSVSASKAYTSGDNTDPLDNGSGISRYGYSFAGWNTMADGSGYSFAAGEDFRITASTTLYAKWTPDNYTVSFNANGGTGSMADQNFTWGTAQALNANAFTKTSYTFAGWSDSAAGAVVYTDTQKVNNLAAGGTVTLYAVWLENSYSVSGNVMEYLDGSTDPSIVADVSVKLMRGIVQFGQETKTDSNGEYSFTGVTAGTYNIVASKSGTSADDSRTMTALVTVSDSDKTVDTIYLPAQKVNSVVTVSENTPAVMVGELDEVAKENAEDGKTVTVTMSVEAKDESAAEGAEELKELAESSSVTGADVEMDYLAISINKIVSANTLITETAITETEQVLEMIVPFNFEGRKNCSIWRYHQNEAQTFEKLSAKPASAAAFMDATYYEDRDNSCICMYGRLFSTYAISYETSSDVTILFKANDGTDTQKTQTITLGAAAALTANSFSRSGYSFTGWNTEADGSGTAYIDQQAITATADLLLYAQWQQNPPAPGPTYFSISFEMNGHGTQIPSKSVAYGAKLEKPEDPIEEGFIFGGWFTDEGLTQEYDFTQAVTSGFKLYAKWTEQTKPGVSLNSISIYTPPAKTEYVEGEKFDPTGMVVSANYTDNSSREVTTYTYTPSGNLAVSDNEITVSYTEEGITRTATQKISVSANITPPGPGPEPGPAEEVDLWNLFEDDSVHEYTVSGVAGGDSIANSNTKSAAFFDAVLDGDTISVSLKSGADRKKAANKANTVLSFALEDGSRVEYLLPVKYVKPSLKLSTKSVSIKEGSKAEVETTILIKAAGNGYEPMDLDGAEVKFNGADADILENGKIRVIAEAAGSGKISVSKPGWESAIELAFTVKTVKKNVLSVDLGGAKYVTLNSNAKNQNFDFPVFLNGEAAGEVSILDKKDSGIASYADGVLTIAYPEAGVKAGSYNIILKTEDASCSVKVKVSDKELSKAVTLKVKSRYDVVTGEPMVITPVLKDVSGEITSVSLDKEGFSAELNENGNIVVNYEGSAYDVKHLDIGTLEFKLGISGADEEVTISLPKVKAKKSVPAVKAAKVTVAKDAAGDVIAVANIVCTYKGSDGRYHSIAPENVKITKLSKGTEAALSEDDPTLVNITKLEKKSGTIKVALSFKGGMTKNVTIRVKKSK